MKKSVIIGVLVCVAFLFLVTLVNGQYDPLLWRYEVFAPNVRSAVCNDNSAYKYYFQPYQEESDKDNWLIYFGGGGLCFDPVTCYLRQKDSPDAMSSNSLADTHLGTGMLSPWSWENPHFYGWNKVYMPYCSSDLWSGTNFGIAWEFRGHDIVDAIFQDITGGHPPYEGAPVLNDSSTTNVVISGGSAGGIGVLINLDFIHQNFFHYASVFGLNDAGWFLNITPFNPAIPPPDVIAELGHIMWSGYVDETCKKAYPTEEWGCYDGNRSYPFINTPMFLQIAQYDGGQLYRLGAPYPFAQDAIPFVTKFGDSIRHSIKQVKGVWSPSCSNHGCITDETCWDETTIFGNTLSDTFAKWLLAPHSVLSVQDNCTAIDCNPSVCPTPPH